MNNTKNILKTATHMAIGAGLLVVCAMIVWGVSNFDLLVKVYKYPEAVRAMNITVNVAGAETK